MTNSKHIVRVVLAATLLWGAGCATDPDDDERDDSAHFEQSFAPPPEIDLFTGEAQILVGCSNAQIRSAQNACRNTFCGTRGSNGIHFCDQRPAQGIVVAQCDCKTGADPQIQCSLSSCPQ